MPYELQQSGGGWFVVTQGSGRKHSRRPLPRARAVAQMRALYANNPEARTKEAGHTGVMIALFVPPAALPAVTALQEGLPNPEPAEDLHLTLAYLGDSAELADQRSALEELLTGIAWEDVGLPMTGTVGGIGRFHHDEGDGTNAVYASFDSPALPGFRQMLVEALRSAGIPFAENHGFTPHITLAYVPIDADIPTLPPAALSDLTFGVLTLAWGDERISYGPATMTEKANYGAHAGETIAGRLVRGGDGKFSSAGAATPDKPAAGGTPAKPTVRRQKLGRTAAARAQARAARRAAKKPKKAAAKKPAAPKKPAAKKPAAARVDPAKREAERQAQQAKRDAERKQRQAQADQERHARQAQQDAEKRTRQAQQDQERAARQAQQDAASERRANDREARQAARDARRQRMRAAPQQQRTAAKPAKSGGGGGGKKQPAAKPDKQAVQAQQRQSNRAVVSSVVGATGVDPSAVTALSAFADGATPDTSTDLGKQMRAHLEALEPLGLVERDSAGGLRLADQGRQFMRAADTGNVRGALDAISRGRDQTAKRTKALTVFKDRTGHYRWLTFSSTAFRDRDLEIVSSKALAADVARADADGDYGPLRWWHMPGVDIGDCDWNAMHGRTLIESGTFRDERYGPLVAAKADDLGVSLGFLHPRHEPDSNRVFHSIRKFERSLVPLPYPSNPYTAVVVKENAAVDDKKIAGLKALGFDDEMIAGIQEQAAAREKSAEQAGVAFKADAPADASPVDAPADDGAVDDSVYVGDLDPDAFVALIGRANQPMVDALAGLAGALTGQATTKAVQDEASATALKATQDALTTLQATLKADREAMDAKLSTALKSIAELQGDVPAGVKRASQDAANVQSEQQLAALKGPAADPMNDFLGFVTGSAG